MKLAALIGFLTALASAFALPAYAASAAVSVTPRMKPPPRGPAHATHSDLQVLKDVKSAVERRNFALAKSLIATVSDPTARSLAMWFYFYGEDPLVSLAEADAFLDAHPGWPAAGRIQSHVEKRIPQSAPAKSVLAFFETRDALTAEGKMQLARAMFVAGDRDAAILQIRDAWVNKNFVLADEQQMLALYGAHLRPNDHIARVDRLLWAREVGAARRVFLKLPANEKRKAEARAALLSGAANATALYDSLDADARGDSGVMLAAVRYFRRLEQEPRAISIAKQGPQDPEIARNPVRWWEERQLLMRWALKEKLWAEAYSMASGHSLEEGTEYAEAEFNAGWIALRFLNAPERAETHFTALANSVGAPISVSRAFYWLGRAAEARGAKDAAEARYQRAALHSYTYYGQLAGEKLAGGVPAQKFASPIAPTTDELARFAARSLAAAVRILADLGDAHAFLIFSYQLDDQLESPGEYVQLSDLAHRMAAPHVAVRAGKVAVNRNAFAPEVAYPVIFLPDEATRFAPAEMILGISRQESEFNPRAFSHAGARGLMQLIPTTAQITAKKEGLKYNRAGLLDDPVYNLTLGAAHLSHLLDRYSTSQIMTFAAYNAGPNRVEEWVRRYGDPRAATVDPVDWVEHIPFAETRNYVQRVLENMQVYRSRLTDAPIAGRLASDIERGGTANRAGLLPADRYALALPPLPERTVRLAAATPLAAPAGTHMAPNPLGSPAATTSGPETADEAKAGDVSIPGDSLPTADQADFIGDSKPLKRPGKPRTPAQSLAPAKQAAEANALPQAPAIIAWTGAPAIESIDAAATCTPDEPDLTDVWGADASAADLNASMLANLRSNRCGTGAPVDTSR